MTEENDFEKGAAERLGEVPLWVFTISIFNLNAAIDRGVFVPVDEIVGRIHNATALIWLTSEPIEGQLVFSDLYENEETAGYRRVLANLFDSMASTVDWEQQMGVKKNGLCLMVAFFTDAIQQWGDIVVE